MRRTEPSPAALPDGAAIPTPARPQRYALRMAIFLAAVVVVAILLHEQAERFFLRNPPLNAVILCVLAAGIALAFRAVLSLEPEADWIDHFREGAAGRLVDTPPELLGPLAALLRASNGDPSLSPAAVRSVLDGVDSRLNERRETLRYLIALLIFLGLLGTFWGLLLMANSVGDTIRSLNVAGADPAQMFERLRAGLEAPLSGMGTAFSTSLFGLASSLVLGFLDLQAGQAQNRFANELETWLTSLVRLDGAGWDDGGAAPSYLCALLEKTATNLDELQRRVGRLLDQNADGGAALRTHLEGLQRAVDRLTEDGARGRDRAVAEMRDEIRLVARTLSVLADRER